MTMELFFYLYLAAVNAAAIILMGMDKARAKRRAWRIPEKTLFLCAILGGSAGSWIGMYLFHHKTKHWYFVLGMPLILILQAAIGCCLIWKNMV